MLHSECCGSVAAVLVDFPSCGHGDGGDGRGRGWFRVGAETGRMGGSFLLRIRSLFFYRRSLRYSRRLYLLTGPVPLHLSLHFYHIYSFLLFVYVSVVFRFSFFLSFFSSLLSGFSFDVRYASLYDRCQKSFEFKVIQFISFWKFHNSIRAFLCTSIANLRGKYDILIKVGFKF